MGSRFMSVGSFLSGRSPKAMNPNLNLFWSFSCHRHLHPANAFL